VQQAGRLYTHQKTATDGLKVARALPQHLGNCLGSKARVWPGCSENVAFGSTVWCAPADKGRPQACLVSEGLRYQFPRKLNKAALLSQVIANFIVLGVLVHPT